MSILWEKSGTWRWIVRQTKESKPFFIAFATICGVVPGVIGYGIMQLTNTRSQQLESHLRHNAPPDSLVESNGTVLSTNWQDVGSKKVEGSPPEGMELKKWEF